ncbi:winged helix-turn-helix domain-containing protein [Acidiferrimicrobium sp. IK]|uniref:MarR family transcriptional regulator n=1 Tax=Acidiferrimicrobium sp. IK TaxID=2871700 RepID=UPI0021CB0718|nr:helix-turn-helix domain-containing protein [Acidiferrimicrobium sp. IK]MCU4185179.1 winged helix-turn-helix domain-containing protein [Acidiferrimicrobium sp. IK]
MARPLQITDDTILDALAARPEVTSTDLAETLGIGQSTAAKRLAALEAGGSVRRTPGGREAGRRAPDRWSAVATPEVAAADLIGGEPGGGELRPAAGEETPEPPAAAGRLGRGELGSLVRDYLAARPGESFGPAALGKALDRSQGAISNSLATMAARGEVVLVGDKPRRYRIAEPL